MPKVLLPKKGAHRKPSRGQKGSTAERRAVEQQRETHVEHVTEKGRQEACEIPTSEGAQWGDSDIENDTSHGSRNSGGKGRSDRYSGRATSFERTCGKKLSRGRMKFVRFGRRRTGKERQTKTSSGLTF